MRQSTQLQIYCLEFGRNRFIISSVDIMRQRTQLQMNGLEFDRNRFLVSKGSFSNFMSFIIEEITPTPFSSIVQKILYIVFIFTVHLPYHHHQISHPNPRFQSCRHSRTTIPAEYPRLPCGCTIQGLLK